MKNRENHRAGYIGKMAHEFAEIARTEGSETLADFLGVAKLEAKLTGEIMP